TIQDKFDTPSNLIYGPFDFEVKLENDGEEVKLRNAEGRTMDTVDYRRRFPWPIVGDPPGNSIELAYHGLDNDLGGSWRPSEPDALAPPTTLIYPGTTWRYFKGYSEASVPTSAWREIDFVDSSWPTGDLTIGYGESFIVTYLNDMPGNYSCIFLRKKFEVSNPSAVSNLKLFAIYDDGFNVWINGESVLPPINVAYEEMPYYGTAGGALEDSDWNEFNLSPPAGCLVSGTNVLAIQLFNSSLSSSSDCFLNVELKNAPALTTPGPTPGQRNTTYSTNIPPHMRQATHNPKQPKSNEDVKITVKVTDPDGVESVSLSYQLVYPGSYIELNDPEYETNWTSLPMTDDGTSGDEKAGDSIYTVVVPGSLHTHRMLVRYRITAKDNTGLSITGPYAHDPQPNFAYFVYDGVPGWYGAIDADSENPLFTKVIYYNPFNLIKVPVYHLISKKDSVEHAMWFDKYGGDLYKWYGTLVYDGDIYDHIRYRARGGVWRYAMGKNMWKFDFNRGHFFQARDDYGKKYDTTWDKLNFSACIQQGSFGQRGEQGMFEALTFAMFNLTGVPAPKTHYIHFRVIDEPYEDGNFNAAHYPLTSSGTQYDGDFWGLHLVLEQMDGRFLDEHGLPDGNLYKMEATYGELNNQGLTAVTDSSDIIEFKNTYENPVTPATWWGENVTLDCYYSYRAVYLAAHHGDITSKNHFFYLNPKLTTNEWGTNNLWWQLPWDVDLTWTTYYGNMSDPFSRTGFLGRFSIFNTASKNRIREVCDLLFNTEQMNQLINEFAAIIDPSGGYSIADADRAMWDYHWVMGDGAYPTYLSHTASFKAGKGRFYEEAGERGYPRTFPGMVYVMRAYVQLERQSYMESMATDYDIPYTPTIASICEPNYPINDLRFVTSAFSDPQGSGTFAAMKWRIAEVTDATCPAYDPTQRKKYEIQTVWESGEITDFNSTVTIPASVVKFGHAYRVRVRMKDDTGRWSHWSNRIHFIVGRPLSSPVLGSLRITELMYNPAQPPLDEPNDKEDLEFIELRNIGQETLDMTHVSF
ncbi:MAG: CotH kinase family protein, partial [candidate division Zixibacteria bacterium]